jgi:hypothetical protein
MPNNLTGTTPCHLTDFQRTCIGERIEDLLDTTDDWGLEEKEFTEAVTS